MQEINTILVAGCSATSGFNYQDDPDDPRIWAQRLCKMIAPTAKVTNIAGSGKNNPWIMLETLAALSRESYDLVLVQTTMLRRLGMHLGFELWPTYSLLNQKSYDIDLHNNIIVSAKAQRNLGETIQSLTNTHWLILDIVKFVNALVALQSIRQQKIFFINGSTHWAEGFFQRDNQVCRLSDLSEFCQSILEPTNRNDSDGIKLYHKMHDDYDRYGTIRSEHWLNLYTPMSSFIIDTLAKDDIHAGDQSQVVFADHLYPLLLDKLK